MHNTLQFFLFDVTINCNLLLIKLFLGNIQKDTLRSHPYFFIYHVLYLCQVKAICKVASSQKYALKLAHPFPHIRISTSLREFPVGEQKDKSALV